MVDFVTLFCVVGLVVISTLWGNEVARNTRLKRKLAIAERDILAWSGDCHKLRMKVTQLNNELLDKDNRIL